MKYGSGGRGGIFSHFLRYLSPNRANTTYNDYDITTYNDYDNTFLLLVDIMVGRFPIQNLSHRNYKSQLNKKGAKNRFNKLTNYFPFGYLCCVLEPAANTLKANII